MKRFFILFLTAAVLVSCLVVPALAYTDIRVFDVDGGWELNFTHGQDMFAAEYTNPSSPLFVMDSDIAGFVLMNSGFLIPSENVTVYGRFKMDHLPDLVEVNGNNCSYYLADGYVYFSVSGNFNQDHYTKIPYPGIGVAVMDYEHPKQNVQLDYLYVRSDSFKELPYRMQINGGDTVDYAAGSYPSKVMTSGYDSITDIIPEGSASIPQLKSSNYHVVVLQSDISSFTSLANPAFNLSFSSQYAGFIGAYVVDSTNHPLTYTANITFSNQTTERHYYQDTSEHLSDYESVTQWTGNVANTGADLDLIYMFPYERPELGSTSYLDYTQILDHEFTYDVDVGGIGYPFVNFNVDLSDASMNGFLTVFLYFTGAPEDYTSSFDLFTCGLFLDGTDVSLGEDQLFFNKLTRFFEDAFGNIITTLHNGFNALIGSSDAPLVVGDLESAADAVSKFEEDQQAVLDENKDIFVNTFDIGMFSAALGFVSGYLSSIFNALGIYQVVFIMPIVIGMFCFICMHVRGVDVPRKYSNEAIFYDSDKGRFTRKKE